MRDPIDQFLAYNRPFARRHPELIRFKIARMAQSPFAFFRGTFHLFARDVLDRANVPLPLLTGAGGEMDLVGDIHSENYGTFKADDGLVHYDVNDFDETTRGRFDFDVCRLAVSHFLAARDRKDSLAQAVTTTLTGIASYTDAVHRCLKKGKGTDLDVSEKTPSGAVAVDELVRAGAAAGRKQFIAKLTEQKDGRRRLIRSVHYFNLDEAEEQQARRLLADYVGRRKEKPEYEDFYAVEDVCGRVSGIGSMGRLRYVVLVAGKGKADGRNVLLEFKEARPSAYDIYRDRDTGPEALAGRAERVVTVQRASQAASNPHLGFALDGGLSFQAREIGPHDMRVDAAALAAPAQLEEVARVQGAILARIHGRAATRAVGPTNPLAEAADAETFAQRVLSFALGYADLVQRDWTRFVGARADLEKAEGWAKESVS
jgi:uncharacterized protein (DUF2252 family)